MPTHQLQVSLLTTSHDRCRPRLQGALGARMDCGTGEVRTRDLLGDDPLG